MLRSMMIGLAIAGLLHVASGYFAPAEGLAVASKRIDWVAVQADSLAAVLCKATTLLAR
jgi:hypothetical protein